MNKKILVLGGSGLVGQTLIKFFKQKKYIVGAVSRKSQEYKDANTYNIDILDYKSLENVIREYDIIINCTGQITNPINQCLALNTDGITNIINAIEKYGKRLIHISSVSVYGSAEYINEESELNPETPYAAIKCFSDYLIKKSLTDYTIIRVSNLFGGTQKKGIVSYLKKSYLSNKKELYFNNNGSLKRFYLYTDDLASMINKIIQKDIKGIYNIIGSDQLTIKELVLMFEKILNFKFHVFYEDIPSLENIENIDCSKLNSKISLAYNMNIQSYIEGLK